MQDDEFESPFFSEDIAAPHSDFWTAKRQLAGAARDFQALMSTAVTEPDTLREMAEELESINARLRAMTHVEGVIAMAKTKEHGSLAVANHELLAVGGHSNPAAPGLRMWHVGDETHGTVKCTWAFEGPPGHVHGGWVAAIFDHFMGVAHMRCGKPGMTKSLEVTYKAPTPLNKELTLIARQEAVSERRTKVEAEMFDGDTMTATAVAYFVKPRSNIFGR